MFRWIVAHWQYPLLAVWACGCAAGFTALMVYASKPGPIGEQAEGYVLPAEFRTGVGDPTLAMYIHPKCPCTRASVRELERLQADLHQPIQIVAFVYEPGSLDGDGGDGEHAESWRDTDLCRSIARMPGTKAVPDPEGWFAAQAGVTTSGTVCLYDGEGRTVFAGGITPSRAHEGDSEGGLALRRLLNETAAGPGGLSPASLARAGLPTRSAVFGCAIHTPTATADID